MPCNTVVRTSQVNLGNVNLDRLSAMLQESGWEVFRSGEHGRAASHGRAYGFAVPDDVVLFARKDGVGLNLKEGDAQLFTRRPGADLQAIQQELVQGYAMRTALEVAKRFGFKVASKTETLSNGAKRLVLSR